jgi:hypothetical protein
VIGKHCWARTNPDPQEVSSIFPGHIIRDGNRDWLTSSQKWHNPPGGFTIPNSLYLASKPALFGNDTWPWVDPTTGTLYTPPAKARCDAGAPFALAPGATTQ